MARQPMDTQDKLKIINADPALWLKNFVKITDAEGKIIPFVLNSEQGDFLSHKGRYNIILKSRQLGMTTVMLGLMLWSAHRKSKSNYMMLSYDTDSVQNIFNRLKQMYESIPDKYRIPEKRNNKMELLLENGSRIAVKVCGYKTVGRSFTNEIIHCSEFAFWSEQQQEKGLLALEQSLNKSDEAFICIESTANGIGNNFYKIFSAAIKGHSKYKAFFYNWYKGSGAKSQFKNEVDIAVKWHSKGIAGKLHEIDLDPYQRKLFDDGCTLRQLMWREYKLQDISEEEFQQEFPSFPDEAFITTNTGVFDALTITQRFKYIPKPLQYKEIDKEIPPLLLPYLNKGLYIYQNVKRSERYFAGIDTSAGLKRDNSAINILDSSGEQVAVFYRNDIPVYKFAKICFELGMYFNYCMYLPERNTYGLDLIQRLRKEMGYIQVLKTKKFDKFTGKTIFEYGWNTDNVSKAKLINDFKETFEEGIILVNDRETLEEMKIYVEDNGKMGNIKGSQNFDDMVIAFALSVQALKTGKWYI